MPVRGKGCVPDSTGVSSHMKIRCHCGAVVPDQTDYLPFKAHLVADRDWEDFVDSSESRAEIDSSYVRLCYQCPQCGRLYIEDASHELHTFMPEGKQTAVLGSCKGSAWRGPLVGSWNDRTHSGQAQGYLWCDAESGTSEYFNEWGQLESAYHALFERLRNLNRLRSAFLRKNGQDVHSWLPEG